MGSTLHIFNGDAAGGSFRRAEGEDILIIREALTHGKLRGYDLDARAAHHARGSTLAVGQIRVALSQQLQTLRDIESSTDVTIWVENDLQCQLTVAWICHEVDAAVPLRLISVGAFAGRPNFRGLGELSAAELDSLRGEAILIESGSRARAAELWRRYLGPDPMRLQEWLDDSVETLPHLRQCVVAHLRRFPQRESGIPMHIAAIVELVRESPRTFATVFDAFSARFPRLGFGDAQLWDELRVLGEAEGAPITIRSSELRPDAVIEARPSAAVPDVRESLGGAAVSWRDAAWSWDAAASRLVAT